MERQVFRPFYTPCPVCQVGMVMHLTGLTDQYMCSNCTADLNLRVPTIRKPKKQSKAAKH
jgi:hypothetical protein